MHELCVIVESDLSACIVHAARVCEWCRRCACACGARLGVALG